MIAHLFVPGFSACLEFGSALCYASGKQSVISLRLVTVNKEEH